MSPPSPHGGARHSGHPGLAALTGGPLRSSGMGGSWLPLWVGSSVCELTPLLRGWEWGCQTEGQGGLQVLGSRKDTECPAPSGSKGPGRQVEAVSPEDLDACREGQGVGEWTRPQGSRGSRDSGSEVGEGSRARPREPPGRRSSPQGRRVRWGTSLPRVSRVPAVTTDPQPLPGGSPVETGCCRPSPCPAASRADRSQGAPLLPWAGSRADTAASPEHPGGRRVPLPLPQSAGGGPPPALAHRPPSTPAPLPLVRTQGC